MTLPRTVLVGLITLLCLSVPPGRAGAAADDPLSLVSGDDSGVTLDYEPPELSTGNAVTPFGTFQDVTIPGHAPSFIAGRPSLPEASRGLAIPENTEPRLHFDILESATIPNIRPLPAQDGPEPEGSRLTEIDGFKIDADYYTHGRPWPETPVTFQELGHLRHHRIGQVVVRPMSWDPATGNLTFANKIRIRIDFVPKGSGSRVRADGQREPATPTMPAGREDAWESVYESALINYESARTFRTQPVPDPQDAGLLRGRTTARSNPSNRAIAGNPEFRLHVGRSGLVRIPYSDLAALGWPAGLPVDQIRVFEKARNESDLSSPLTTDVPVQVLEYDTGTAGVFDADDEILVHARDFEDRFLPAVEIGRYTHLHVYWLTWDPAGGARMPADAGWADGSSFATPPNFETTVHFEENRLYIYPAPYIGPTPDVPTWETTFWTSPVSARDSLDFGVYGLDPAGPARIRATWQRFFDGSRTNGVTDNRVTISVAHGTPEVVTPLATDALIDGPAAWTFDSGVIAGSSLAEGTNRFKYFGSRASTSGRLAGTGAYFDAFDVTYTRRYIAHDDVLAFTNGGTTGNVEFTITGLTQPDLVLVDVTDPGAPRRVDLANARITQISGPPRREFELRFRATLAGSRSYIVMTNAAIPSYRSAVASDGAFTPGRLPRDIGPSNLVADTERDILTDSGADMIVITHPDFEDALTPWLDLRRSQGHTILVASPQDIYDVMSGGDKSVPAIRDWLRAIYRGWAKSPDYLVLAGDASEDYRRDVLTSDPDWVPTMMQIGPVYGDGGRYELVGQDNYFVRALAPGDPETDLLPDMHVGRLPIGSAAETQILVDKLVRYDDYQPGDAWRNRGMIATDDTYSVPITGGGDYRISSLDCDFWRGADDVLADFAARGCSSGFTIDDLRLGDCLNGAAGLGRIDVPRDQCINASPIANLPATVGYVDVHCTPEWVETASRGHLFQLYSGHGNRFIMTTEGWVDYVNGHGNADQLTNYGKPFIFFGVACHLNEFEHFEERTSKHALAEAMLFLPNAGAIASMASTGFEWLPTNRPVETYMARYVFLDPAIDPGTGRPRRVLGEGIDRALVTMAAEKGGGIFLNTLRTYGLLGDPTMPIDMAPPSFTVNANGVPASSGASLVAAADATTARVEADIADDVDTGAASFTLTDGGAAVPPENYTLTPRDGACGGVHFVYEPEIRPDTYTIDLTAGDWVGRNGVFQLKVNLDVRYTWGGAPISDLDFVPLEGALVVTVTSPVGLVAGDIDVLVNGQGGYFTVTSDGSDRVWTATLDRTLPAGRVDLMTRVRGKDAKSLSLSAGDELNFSDVYFYPNPWDGVSPARFTYQLRYREGDRPRHVTVRVFTVSGRQVASLDAPADGGRSWLDWDGRDREGDVLANGVYLYKLTIETADGKKLDRIDRLVVHR